MIRSSATVPSVICAPSSVTIGSCSQVRHRVAQFPRIAHADRKSLQALHGLGDRLAADGRGNHALHVVDVHAIAGGGFPIDVHFDVAATREPLRQRGADAAHVPDRQLDPVRDSVDHRGIRSGDLDADGTLDAGGEHVDAVANGRDPDIGEPRDREPPVELQDELLRRHAGSPLIARLEPDRGFHHFQRCGVGRGFGATHLAEDTLDLRHGHEQPVHLLQELRGLARGQSRQGGRHVQQVALVQRRHEFPAEAQERERRERKQHDAHGNGELAAAPARDRAAGDRHAPASD